MPLLIPRIHTGYPHYFRERWARWFVKCKCRIDVLFYRHYRYIIVGVKGSESNCYIKLYSSTRDSLSKLQNPSKLMKNRKDVQTNVNFEVAQINSPYFSFYAERLNDWKKKKNGVYWSSYKLRVNHFFTVLNKCLITQFLFFPLDLFFSFLFRCTNYHRIWLPILTGN